MNRIKCFDIVDMVLQDATLQFSPVWMENTEKKNVLKEYCNALDKICEEFNGEAFEVEVDENDMTISIKMFCYEMTIESKRHLFYELVRRSKLLDFEYDQEDDNMSIRFVFPSIWSKAY